jgi:carbamoyltransferase
MMVLAQTRRTAMPVATAKATALIGIGGSRRNACAALCIDGEVQAVCEQERLTRVRGVGLTPGRLPGEAVDAVLAISAHDRGEIRAYVTAETGVHFPASVRVSVDHHRAHAATAYFTSPHAAALVLVCDRDPDGELSVWAGEGPRLEPVSWGWKGVAFATLYSECARLFNLRGDSTEHQLEALAHLDRGDAADLAHEFRYEDRSLQLAPGWQSRVYDMVRDEEHRSGRAVRTAASVQRRIGEVLLEMLTELRQTHDGDTLCLGGGLFFNTYFTTLVRRSGLFANVFVPLSPGNAGLAVGAALLLASEQGDVRGPSSVSPFLGPEYDAESIKATLDGCKLSYTLVSENQALDEATDALARGQIVGWFKGRMEWGSRALGHRSILASPLSPYVLDNLNGYLRKREPWRPFGLSVAEELADRHFCGPDASRFMEYEYTLRDDRLRHAMPPGATAVRVQTVGPETGDFWRLHRRMAQATGAGVLVHTSFNGFQEPIVCTPRDAIRVFYGTGIDVLILDRFILRK